MEKYKTIKFGSWFTLKDGTVKPIEWLVINEAEEDILLLSKFGIESKQYHEQHTYVKWEKSDLRKWLNGTFLNSAFSESEKSYLSQMYRVVNNSIAPVFDMVSLLSIEEANQFLSKKQLCCEPTEWCIQNGGWKSQEGYSIWWLLQPGQKEVNQSLLMTGEGVFFDACVAHFGEILPRGDSVDEKGDVVRPLIQIKKIAFIN